MHISHSLKHFIKKPFHAFGMDLVVRRPHPLRFLASLNVKTVLDVGAFVGDFAADVRRFVPNATVHCFEPLPSSYVTLCRAMASDPLVKTWNLAVGEECGKSIIHVGQVAATSSLLAPSYAAKMFESARTVGSEVVAMTTLDAWAKYQALETPIVLKADVQGLERSVLLGAAELLTRTSVLIIEVSFEELYKDQSLFDDIYQQALQSGFVLSGMIEPIFDPETKRQVQSNAVFCRPRLTLKDLQGSSE